MESIWLKIISNKSNPACWPAVAILWIVSLFYRFGLYLRNRIVSDKVKTKAPVISIGNLTVGGTGKTPLVIEIARHFLNKNCRVGVVGGGYHRAVRDDIVAIGSDISRMSIDKIGDELMLLAESLPEAFFAVTGSKSNSARLLDNQFTPDVIIIDDGFQHRRLHRDTDILLFDATLDLRKESLFPLGRLREPLSAAGRAGRVLLTKANFVQDNNSFTDWCLKNFTAQKPLAVEFINDSIISDNSVVPIDSISGTKCFFFAGIAGFNTPLNAIKNAGLELAGFRRFPDHHSYRTGDIASLQREIAETGPEYLITTYKDYVKLRDFDFGRQLYYLNLKLNFGEAGRAFFERLDSIISKR